MRTRAECGTFAAYQGICFMHLVYGKTNDFLYSYLSRAVYPVLRSASGMVAQLYHRRETVQLQDKVSFVRSKYRWRMR